MRGLPAASTFWHNSLYMFFSQYRPEWVLTVRRAASPVKSCHRQNQVHILTLLCMSLLCPVAAQVQQSAVPTVTFTCDFPGSEPDHYVVSVSDDGNAKYDSDSRLNNSAASEPFHADFTVSQDARTRVFDLTKRANYFQSDLDSKKKNLASTGVKTLTYKDAQKSTRGTYNYSPTPAVQALTAFFQSLATTLEFGHRLDYYLHYQKLALDEELKKMEEMSKSGGLEEISAIAPILQKIADDPAVIKVVRARAQGLMQAPATKGK